MADAELHCNFRKCHKVLEYVGYITSCSHAFCAEHGQKILKGDRNALKCPVCNTILTEGQDIVRTNLNPTEKYKSMVLAGLKPDDALEIIIRSMRFWTFQISQEISRSKLISDHYRSQIEDLKSDMANAERSRKTHEAQMKQMSCALEKQKIELLEKNRMIQKLQIDLDNEKRQKISLQNQQQILYDSPNMNLRAQTSRIPCPPDFFENVRMPKEHLDRPAQFQEFAWPRNNHSPQRFLNHDHDDLPTYLF